MNRHFQAYNALPCAPLGAPKVAEKQQASDGEWKPLRPGHESRTLAGGAVEVRSAPGWRPDVTPSTQSREPAYQPEGFGYAHVDHRGHQGEAIPKQTEPGTFKGREQAAFEDWLYRALPSGDAESVHGQWMASAERAEFLEQEEGNVRPVVKRVAKPAAADVPEGATHRAHGLFYRANGDEAQYWSTAHGCWVASGCCSANGLKRSGVFTRLHPEPQQ